MDDVINFQKILIEKGKKKFCDHRQLEIDQETRTVSCVRCGDELTPWDALLRLSRIEGDFHNQVNNLRREISDLRKWNPRLRAVKELHRIWSSKHMLPVCPHCRVGIEAIEVVASGSVDREYNLFTARRRRAEKERKENDGD